MRARDLKQSDIGMFIDTPERKYLIKTITWAKTYVKVTAPNLLSWRDTSNLDLYFDLDDDITLTEDGIA